MLRGETQRTLSMVQQQISPALFAKLIFAICAFLINTLNRIGTAG
jgi:hypothetical protein